MDLAKTVLDMETKTKELIAANPYINQISWHIKDVPYNEFELFRKSINIYKSTPISGCMVYWAKSGHIDNGCDIVVWSVPVEIETNYIVTEKQTKNENTL